MKLQVIQVHVCVLFSCIIYSSYSWLEKDTTAVSFPGKSRGRRNLVGCSPWGRKEWLTLAYTYPWWTLDFVRVCYYRRYCRKHLLAYSWLACPGVGLGCISRDAIAGVRMASASTPLPGASVKVHYKEQRSLAHQDRKGFSIGYRSFAAMLAGLREQTLGWASRNDSQSHTKRLGHQKSCHLPLHQEVMFRTGKLPG